MDGVQWRLSSSLFSEIGGPGLWWILLKPSFLCLSSGFHGRDTDCGGWSYSLLQFFFYSASILLLSFYSSSILLLSFFYISSILLLFYFYSTSIHLLYSSTRLSTCSLLTSTSPGHHWQSIQSTTTHLFSYHTSCFDDLSKHPKTIRWPSNISQSPPADHLASCAS